MPRISGALSYLDVDWCVLVSAHDCSAVLSRCGAGDSRYGTVRYGPRESWYSFHGGGEI